jgi:uncharacterized protein YeaO (DUF488 family)
MIRVKRIYEPASQEDGFRLLVDRLWPRGVSKGKSKIDLWLKEVAPSSELRKRFSHQPKRWETFKKHYAGELGSKKELLQQIRELERKNGTVTLLYAARDQKRNNAVALKEFLRKR